MCQLLGMYCADKTDFTFSFKGFCQRGGKTDIHSHGFGIVIYEGRGVRTFHDTQPAAISPVAQLVQHYPIRTYNMMAHVRYATTGGVCVENVHPFTRELWGIIFSFSHNGQVPKFDHSTKQEDQPLLGKTKKGSIHYHPVGDTDSEAVFCAILNALKAEFETLPTLPVLHQFLSNICQEIIHGEESSTIFNFLLGCGQYTLFAYSWPGKRPNSSVWNGLYYIIRETPFSTAKLIDADYSIDFAEVNNTNVDRVAVITTKPLTDEIGWTEFRKGELIMFDNGLPHFTPSCCESVEQKGRGLYSRCFPKLSSPKLCPIVNPSSSSAAATCTATSEAEATPPKSRSRSMSTLSTSSSSSELSASCPISDLHEIDDDSERSCDDPACVSPSSSNSPHDHQSSSTSSTLPTGLLPLRLSA